MNLIGLMPARNEDWVLGLSARVALTWCDRLILLVHASRDRTIDIAMELHDEYGDRVILLIETAPIWDEMRHRQRMLETARSFDATHIAIVDADEVLTGNVDREHLRMEIDSASAVHLPIFNLRGGINTYHATGLWADRWVFTAFRDRVGLGWDGDRFHAREPGKFQSTRPMQHAHGGIMHLWGSSERRLRAKHALYKLTERLRWPSKSLGEIERTYNWAIYGRPAYDDTPIEWKYADVPDCWWKAYANWMPYLDVDAEPWQEAECRRLVELHGKGTFAGLDLFGVA